MKNYTITKMCKTRRLYEFKELNKKGEKLAMEVTEIYPDNTNKDSLPNLWKKHGYTKKLYNSYLVINTYVTDKNGVTWGYYNVTEKLSNDNKRKVINFDYLLEVSKDNEIYLLNTIYSIFKNGGDKSE